MRALVLAIALAHGASVEAADTGLWDLSLEELAATKITVASRVEERADRAPSSVTVFQPSDFSSLGARYVEDVLNYVPGLTVNRSPERGSVVDTIAVRGRRSSQDSPDVLFLLDGRRLNNELTGSISPFIRRISLVNVKQLEVIRGPGSSLYGSNAFSAVVNIVTDPERREAVLGVGNRGDGTFALANHWQGEGGKLSLFAQGDYREGEAYRLNDGLRPADKTRDAEQGSQFYGVYQKEALQLSARYASYQEEDFVLNRFVDDDVNHVDAEHWMLDARYTLLQGETSELAVSAGVQQGWDRLLLGLPADSLRTGPLGSWVHFPVEVGAELSYRELGTAVDGHLQWGEHRLAAGMAVREHQDRTSDRIANYDPMDGSALGGVEVVGDQLINHDGRQVKSAYLEDRIPLGERLSANLGLRYDEYEEVGESANHRAALMWQLTPEDVLKAQYGTAFRAPSRAEIAGSAFSSLIGNPGLEPERVATSELVWIRSQQAWRSELTLFNNHIQDPIERISSPTGMQASYNGEAADFTGFEWAGRWQFAEGWSAFGAWSRVTRQEQEIKSAASRFGHAGLTFSAGQWSLSGHLRYHGDVEAVDGGVIDSYTLLNISLERQFGAAQSAYLRLSNLLGEEYQTYTGSYNPANGALADGVPGQGRGVLLGWKYHFE